ncbi:hypothetical protein LCGC14_2863570 [marine sediment metagenome]|uniref:Uncharacterized protein n=1 Tax=marine sediment metagenome TaxID=412755 RepID=A0A0F8YRR4_9ZZZZ
MFSVNGVVCFAAIALAVASYFAAQDSANQQNRIQSLSQEASDKADLITTLTQDNSDKLQEAELFNITIKEKSDKILLLNEKLVSKSDEIQNLQNEIVSFTTGKGSYPEVSISADNNLMLSAVGDYMVYDIGYRIKDVTTMPHKVIFEGSAGNIPAEHIFEINSIQPYDGMNLHIQTFINSF